MKILIDECLPKRLKRGFEAHEVFTVPEMGWAGKKNGELLKLMSGSFDVFVTVDQNLEYQQNLSEVTVAFIVFVAAKNTLDSLTPLIPQALTALETIQPGDFIVITPPEE
jgi:hypothetical protein